LYGGSAVAAAKGVEGLSQCDAFAGAVRVAMRIENLLDQRSPRTRHADDEDRRWVGIAGPRSPGKACAIEQHDVGVDKGAMRGA
jgi:hypothetical protein